MVRLNHERPYLKYIDNLKREILRDNGPASLRLDQTQPNGPDVNYSFNLNLSNEEIDAILDLLNLSNQYLEKFGEVIALLFVKGNKDKKKELKSQKDDIYGELMNSAQNFLKLFMIAELDKRSGLQLWYKKFEPRLKKENEFVWDFINNQVLHDALELYEPVLMTSLREFLNSKKN